jgi:porphobilinogen synthase
MSIFGKFPNVRMRRNRKSDWCRRLISENNLSVNDLILPIFVQEGTNKSSPIGSMPDIKRLSIDLLVEEIKKAEQLGVPAVSLFPVIDQNLKTEKAEESYNQNNLLCRTVAAIKKANIDIGIICDVALDPYTSHGHDGIVRNGMVENDETVEILCKQAVSQAKAGCDIVAPSDMMDGRIGAIRQALDKEGFQQVQILSYAAKYASHFYGPFRDAVGSSNNLGNADKRTYQMNPTNSDEAIKEIALDIQEGADMIMVKPGMPYLDIIRMVKDTFKTPIFAYQVSGEYAMIKAASENGWLNSEYAMMESLIAFKRAGAIGIFTYAAIEVAEKLK